MSKDKHAGREKQNKRHTQTIESNAQQIYKKHGNSIVIRAV